MVKQLEKVRPNPDNIQKPFNKTLIFHASFVQMYPRPLPKIHAEPVVDVINPAWRRSAWLVQWINLTVHKSDLLLYVRLVFKRSPRSIKTANCCQNAEASPSPLSTASEEKNPRNLGAQTFRQHPKRRGEKPTHAAVQTPTNILILVSVRRHKSEKWITDAAAKKQTWNTGRRLTAMCEAELGDRFCTVNSITLDRCVFLLWDLLRGEQVPPSKMSRVCCLSISPSKELRFSSRPRCFDEKTHLREPAVVAGAPGYRRSNAKHVESRIIRTPFVSAKMCFTGW